MKPIDVKSSTYIDFNLEIITKIFNLRLVTLFAKSYIPNWPEEDFLIRKVKNIMHGHMLIVILMVKKFLKQFTIKKLKRQIKQRLELKKQSREKVIN